MGVVSDLISGVTNSSSGLSDLLRKARILASELGSPELRAWTEAELNGYKDEDTLPDYRVSVGSNFGNFSGYFGLRGTGVPIPLSTLPEGWRERYSKLELRGGVASIQEMFRSNEKYREQWSADAIAAVAQDIVPEMNMTNAWKDIPRARLAAVLDSVRNRLLTFLLDLKEQHPEVEVADANLQSISKEDVRVSVVNNIYGGQNVLASGGSVNQQVHQGVEPGSLASLLNALRKAPVPEELILELPKAIEEDKSVRSGGLGPKVSRWLANVAEKASAGTAAGFATQALLQYYGLSGA